MTTGEDIALHLTPRLLAELRDRALHATSVSITVSDPRVAGNPLVWANPAFTELTGYPAAEVVGRNCRFLQGPGTDPATVEAIRGALEAEQPVTATLLNYRKDGTSFHNQLSLSPVFDDAGALCAFVGVQTDVSDRVNAQRERENANGREWAVRQGLELLAESAGLLATSLDLDAVVQGLAELAVPRLADWCAIDLLDSTRAARRVATAHVQPEQAALVRRLADEFPLDLDSDHPVAAVLRGGAALLAGDVTSALRAKIGRTPEQLRMLEALAPTSLMVVPLSGRGQVLGALTLASTDRLHRYLDVDLQLAVDLGARAGLTIDAVRLYQREHQVAEALQRRLLPELPTLPGLRLAWRYQAGAVGVEVGGDWYDVLALPDGAVGIAVGDVMGHDLAAAAAMGQLRSVVRSYAWEGASPGEVLDRLDRLVQGLDMAQLATALFARLERTADDGCAVLRYANAGHLAPLLRRPDGTARFLEEGRSMLIGGPGEGAARPEASERMPPGTLLLLYTDGLIERRDADLGEGLERLRATVEALPPTVDPEVLCDTVLARVPGPTLTDDVALLAIQME